MDTREQAVRKAVAALRKEHESWYDEDDQNGSGGCSASCNQRGSRRPPCSTLVVVDELAAAFSIDRPTPGQEASTSLLAGRIILVSNPQIPLS